MNTLEQLRADYEALGQRIERMEFAILPGFRFRCLHCAHEHYESDID